MGQRPTPETPDAKREKPLVRVSILDVASSAVAPIVYPDLHCRYDAARLDILTREVTPPLFLSSTVLHCLGLPLSPSVSLFLSLHLFLFPSFPPGRPERSHSVPPDGDIPNRS